MPLCARCKAEAYVTVNREARGGERDNSLNPGLDAGSRCDECGLEGD